MSGLPPKTDLPPDSQQLSRIATQMEEELAALRARFDQYFLGLERKHPGRDLDGYRSRLLALKNEFLRNTALKFRVQSLFQKFQSYERIWLKSLKEMEEGTYSRDLAKLRRKRSKVTEEPPLAKAKPPKGAEAPPPVPPDSGTPPPRPATTTQAPPPVASPQRAPPAPPSAANAASPAPPSSDFGLSTEKIKLLYDAFITAKRRCNESTDGITPQALAQSLRKQVPQLLKAHGAKSIDFKIVIKDGKAVLRAVPR